MEWTQVFTIVGANIALIFASISTTLYLFRECNEDRRRAQQEMKEFRDRWEAESKDFHARLLLIEERNKNAKT
jgi:hypothetical protein